MSALPPENERSDSPTSSQRQIFCAACRCFDSAPIHYCDLARSVETHLVDESIDSYLRLPCVGGHPNDSRGTRRTVIRKSGLAPAYVEQKRWGEALQLPCDTRVNLRRQEDRHYAVAANPHSLAAASIVSPRLTFGPPLPQDRATRRGIQAGFQHRQARESPVQKEHEVFPGPQAGRERRQRPPILAQSLHLLASY
jgi:hypothetical protein